MKKIFKLLLLSIALFMLGTKSYGQEIQIIDSKIFVQFNEEDSILVDDVISWDDMDFYINHLPNREDKTFALINMSKHNCYNRNQCLRDFSIFNSTKFDIILIANPTLYSIGGGAFESCTAINSIYLPNSLYAIGGTAFKKCSFSQIVIPETVTVMGDYAFASNKKLKEVVILGHPKFNDNVFSDCPNATIFVKEEFLKDFLTEHPNLNIKKIE